MFEILKPTEEKLHQEATNMAIEKFNIVHSDDGTPYITYEDVIISRKSDEDILDRLQELRERYVTDYVTDKKKYYHVS